MAASGGSGSATEPRSSRIKWLCSPWWMCRRRGGRRQRERRSPSSSRARSRHRAAAWIDGWQHLDPRQRADPSVVTGAAARRTHERGARGHDGTAAHGDTRRHDERARATTATGDGRARASPQASASAMSTGDRRARRAVDDAPTARPRAVADCFGRAGDGAGLRFCAALSPPCGRGGLALPTPRCAARAASWRACWWRPTSSTLAVANSTPASDGVCPWAGGP